MLKTYNCLFCGKEFTEKYSKYADGRFCSRECARKYSSSFCTDQVKEKISKSLKEYYKTHISPKHGQKNIKRSEHFLAMRKQNFIEWKCPICGKILKLSPREATKRKFCSGSCRNKYNNQFIKGSRSKGEILLYETLKKKNIPNGI